jgi:hypothetical protein
MSAEKPQPNMTKGEREELVKLVKARTRVAGRVVDQRAAELLADVERQLATEYKVTDAAWSDLTAAAARAVQEADRGLAERCRALGIPEECRPRLSFSWFERGQNLFKDRRDELRRVAVIRIEALAEAARVEIEQKALDGLTLLIAGGLESSEAKAMLTAIPTPEALMPKIDLASLGPLAALPGTRSEEPPS